MKIIIAGAGRIGYSIAEILAGEGHEISIIDQNSESIAFVSNNLDVVCFEGNAANPQILAEAGAANADLVVAVSQKDEINMEMLNIFQRGSTIFYHFTLSSTEGSNFSHLSPLVNLCFLL